MHSIFALLRYGLASLLFLAFLPAQAQPLLLDMAIGRSLADHGYGQAALRWQANEAFRLGFEAQGGYFSDRYLAAQPVQNGTVWTFSLPASLRLLENDRLRADVYLRPGLRFTEAPQRTADAPAQTSQAWQLTPGLLLGVKASERLWLQSGVMMPFTFEYDPAQIDEQIQSYQILAGAAYRLNDQLTLTAQSPFGPSYGGDGDTAKFLWTLSLGIRVNLGALNPLALLLDPAL